MKITSRTTKAGVEIRVDGKLVGLVEVYENHGLIELLGHGTDEHSSTFFGSQFSVEATREVRS